MDERNLGGVFAAGRVFEGRIQVCLIWRGRKVQCIEG
jgi:hypothetical protein